MAVAGTFARADQTLACCRRKCRACLFGVKTPYRDRLHVSEEVKFVYLRGDFALIEEQLRSRRRHFMDPDLLQSQFDDLEEPQPDEHVVTVQLGGTPEEILDEIKAKLHLASGH